MKIALVSDWDCTSPASWSGTPYFVARALAATFERLVVIDRPQFTQLAGSVEERLQTLGAYVTARLDEESPDAAVFLGTAGLAACPSPCRKVIWHDSTWYGLLSRRVASFAEFATDWPALRRWDEATLENADCAFFASEWARGTAAVYPVLAERLGVLPFGANLVEHPDLSQVREMVASRPRDVCRLLFVGRDWRRKGLLRAAAVADALRFAGLATTLTVIGLPEGERPVAGDQVIYVGVLDKACPADRLIYANHLRESHFLIHPASFECFGVAVAEAKAFGVPAVASAVTGLASVVGDGHDGLTFPLDAFPSRVATVVADLFSDREAYGRFALSAYLSFASRFEWGVVASELRRRLKTLVAPVPAAQANTFADGRPRF